MSLEKIMSESLRYVDGVWVSKDFERIARIIQDTWNGVVELTWIPESVRGDSDLFPFAVIENMPDGSRAVVCYLQAADINHSLIAKLFDMNSDTLADRLAHIDLAKQLVAAEEEADRREELHDKARFLWRSPLHSIKMDGKVWNL